MNALLFKALTMFALMFGLAEAGNVPPAETPVQQQWQIATMTTAQRMLGIVEETQAQLQVQAQTMKQTQGELPEPAEDAFAYMNGYLNRIQQDLEEGLTDPLAFRARVNSNRPEDAPTQPDMVPGEGNGVCDGEDCEPAGDANRYGQEEDNDGQNGDGDGDGVCENDCEPAGDENHYGQEDDNDGQNGDGDGDGVCENDCEPAGDENHYGNGGK